MSARKRREARRRLWGIGYRILVAMLVLAGVAIKVLIDTKVWTDPPTWLLPAVLIGVGVAAFRDSIVSALAKYRAPGRRERSVNVEKALIAAVAQIAEHSGVSMMNLGASVFMVHNGPRWIPMPLRERWSRTRPRLERTRRFRLDDNPQPSDVAWFKGKGTIGDCWRLDKVQHCYWLPVAEKYGDHDFTEEGFQRIKESTRMGLTRQEFSSIVGKYAEILAVPIKEADGQLVGVLSVDLARRGRDTTQGKILDSDSVERLVTTAAAVIEKNR